MNKLHVASINLKIQGDRCRKSLYFQRKQQKIFRNTNLGRLYEVISTNLAVEVNPERLILASIIFKKLKSIC